MHVGEVFGRCRKRNNTKHHFELFCKMELNTKCSLTIVLICTLCLFLQSSEGKDTKALIYKPSVNPHRSVEVNEKPNEHNGAVNFEVCDVVCNIRGCTYYYCPGDGICCTPGSPTSTCCPASFPLCIYPRCCPIGYPKLCGLYCCIPDSVCCQGDTNCCKTAEACCGSQCCEDGFTCCKENGENTCCKTKDACCGSECCEDTDDTCCTNNDKKTCCSKDKCCDDDGECSPACASQFDAIPCDLLSMTTADTLAIENLQLTSTCRDYTTEGYLYRLLRPDESCEAGIRASAPLKKRTVFDHVRCGGERFTTPYISTTSTKDKDTFVSIYLSKAKLLNRRLVRMETKNFSMTSCYVFADLTKESVRKEYLGDDVLANRWAVQACEVIVYCLPGFSIPCEEIPYMEDIGREEL